MECFFIPCHFSNLVDIEWYVLFVYASSVYNARRDQFIILVNYRHQITNHFIVIGDFNFLLNLIEKTGGHHYSRAKIQLFRDFVHSLGILDLGYSGPMPTGTIEGKKEQI